MLRQCQDKECMSNRPTAISPPTLMKIAPTLIKSVFFNIFYIIACKSV